MEVAVTVATDWWDKAAFFLSGFTLAGLLALIVVWRQLGSMEKARHAQALLHFLEVWDSPGMVEAQRELQNYTDPNKLADAIHKFYEAKSIMYYILTRIPDFFDDMGFAWRKGYLRLEDIQGTLGSPLVEYFWLYEAYIERVQQRWRQYPSVYQDIVALAYKLRNGVNQCEKTV